MISFGLPWAFVLLPLPLLVWRFLPAHKERVPAIRFPFFRRVVAEAQVTAAAGAVVMGRAWFQMLVAAFIWAMLVLAIARPERLGAPIETRPASAAIILSYKMINTLRSNDGTDHHHPSGTEPG